MYCHNGELQIAQKPLSSTYIKSFKVHCALRHSILDNACRADTDKCTIGKHSRLKAI